MTPAPPDPTPADDAAIQFPQANIAAMRVVARTLGSTLGPLGRDKLIVAPQADDSDAAPGTRLSGDVAVASDGAAILERLPVEHPIAPILRRMIGPERPGDTGVEGEDMPDGITTRAVLAGALLDRAEALLDRGLHPRTLVDGYGSARETAFTELAATRREFADLHDPAEARRATARTAMTGNVPAGDRAKLAEIAVEAVETVGSPNQRSFDVRRTDDGAIADTGLVRGAVLDRASRATEEMPDHVSDATILVLDGHERGGLQDRDVQSDVSMRVDSPETVTDLDAARRDHRETVVDRFAERGVDVVVARLGIDADYQRLLADRGIMGIRGVAPLDLTRVARATGASPVLDPTDVAAADLGRAGSVRELSFGPRSGRSTPRTMVAFDDCPDPGTVTVLLRGASGQIADQAATAVRKGAFALGAAGGASPATSGVVPGGGAIHLHVATAVRRRARTVDDRQQLAMEAYAAALEDVVGQLARNGGLDPLDVVPDVRAAHDGGAETTGLVFPEGRVGDCLAAGVLDPVATVRTAYLYATDVACLLLRIDDAIDAVTTEPSEDVDTDDVIYDEPAELQEQTLDERE